MPSYRVSACVELVVGADDTEAARQFLRELVDEGTFGPSDFVIRAAPFDDEEPHSEPPADPPACPKCDGDREFRIGVLGTPYLRCWRCGEDEPVKG